MMMIHHLILYRSTCPTIRSRSCYKTTPRKPISTFLAKLSTHSLLQTRETKTVRKAGPPHIQAVHSTPNTPCYQHYHTILSHQSTLSTFSLTRSAASLPSFDLVESRYVNASLTSSSIFTAFSSLPNAIPCPLAETSNQASIV